MNPILFAMRRPITVMMVIVALIGGGILALNQMRVDIFPAINAPQIYVVNNYAGMDPSQIEGIITNVYEQNFQYVDGLKADRIEEHPEPGAAQADLLSGHRHGGGDVAGGQPVESGPRADAAQRAAAVRDAFRRGQRAHRLPGAGEQDAGRWANWPIWACTASARC